MWTHKQSQARSSEQRRRRSKRRIPMAKPQTMTPQPMQRLRKNQSQKRRRRKPSQPRGSRGVKRSRLRRQKRQSPPQQMLTRQPLELPRRKKRPRRQKKQSRLQLSWQRRHRRLQRRRKLNAVHLVAGPVPARTLLQKPQPMSRTKQQVAGAVDKAAAKTRVAKRGKAKAAVPRAVPRSLLQRRRRQMLELELRSLPVAVLSPPEATARKVRAHYTRPCGPTRRRHTFLMRIIPPRGLCVALNHGTTRTLSFSSRSSLWLIVPE
mmetsp:Transcript_5907/g.12989  ORF Transcript_5907/g.12989 Transcript_5907/m.12989 type:complete len:264 (-) Transcript_5907:530-1321(-)